MMPLQLLGSDLSNADVLLSQFIDEESIENLIKTGSEVARAKNRLKMQEVRELITSVAPCPAALCSAFSLRILICCTACGT